jgi:heme-degrading monooxygenase HmoA
MSVYATTERRVAPELQPIYFDLVRRTRDLWAAEGGLLFNRIASAVDDPSRLIGITRWRTVEALEAALRATPPDLLAAFAAVVAEGYGKWQVYRPVRELENYAVRPQSLVGDLVTVREEDVDRFLRACRPLQEQVIRLPGIAASRLLRSVDDPTRFLGISELADEAAAARRRRLIRELAPTFPGLAVTFFTGRIGSQWDVAPPVVQRRR